jgi:hypothetical protein
MATAFPGFQLFAGSISPLHDTEMKQLMNAAERFSTTCENVRKCFAVKD